MTTPEAWARGGLAAVGTITFGAFAAVHILLALVVVGLWVHYALTADPRRVAALYALGTGAGLVLKESL